MKPEIKQAWIDALRSGHYQQSQGALKRCGGFCCLGVLCDLHMKATQRANWEDIADAEVEDQSYLGRSEYMPNEVFVWAGFDEKDRFHRNRGEDVRIPSAEGDLRSLGGMNDRGVTFNEIAAAIETHL
jgi:hypothetical protein